MYVRAVFNGKSSNYKSSKAQSSTASTSQSFVIGLLRNLTCMQWALCTVGKCIWPCLFCVRPRNYTPRLTTETFIGSRDQSHWVGFENPCYPGDIYASEAPMWYFVETKSIVGSSLAVPLGSMHQKRTAPKQHMTFQIQTCVLSVDGVFWPALWG